MLKNRFHKYYHPKNNYFFLHIAVDAILILAFGSILAYNIYFIGHPVKSSITSGYFAMPKQNHSENISASTNSEEIAKQKILHELKLSAICRYTLAEGDQLGVGPLPPKVGETTKYWIFLSPSTNYFDVSDVIVTAKLADNVVFTGRTSAVSETGIIYDEASRQISWKISRLSFATDASIPPGAAFEIAYLPTSAQAGKTAELLTDINISGQDSVSSVQISNKAPDLSTRIKEDQNGGIISE